MKKSNIVWIALGSLVMSVAGWSETINAPSNADILRQAKAYQFQFRDGHYDVAQVCRHDGRGGEG